MATVRPRRLVDAVDDLRAEIRTANLIAVLTAPVATLEDFDLSKPTSPGTRARHEVRNRLKAEVRAQLGIGEDDV
jgi:hypothetical protein